MSRYIGDANGQPYSNNNAEATYYCEQYDYDYARAKEAFDQDREFERQQLLANTEVTTGK